MALDVSKLKIKGLTPGKKGGLSPIDYSSLKIKGLSSGNGNKAVNSGKIFDGGFFSDVLDILQVPQTALTGLLDPRVSIAQAVKTRYTPADAFGLKNPVARFATDLVLDPLNFVAGFGATSKGAKLLKTGEEAATLGGAARNGEKVLLGLGLPFSSKGVVPLIKGEKILEGATKLGNTAKGLPFVGKTLEALGSVPGLKTGKTVEEIETAAKNFERTKALKNATVGVERELKAQAGRVAVEVQKEMDNIIKAGKATEQDLLDVTQSVARPGSIEIKPQLKEFTAGVAEKLTKLRELYSKLGGPELDSKVVKNVLTKDALETVKSTKPFVGQVREIGGTAGIEQFAKNVGLRDELGKTTFAQFKGKSRATLEGGGNVRKLIDDTYGTYEAAKFVDLAKAKAIAASGSLSAAERAKVGQQAIKDAVEELRQSKPGSVFSRTAVTPREANTALAKAGSTTRFRENISDILLSQGQDVAKMAARQHFAEGFKKLGIGQIIPPGMPRSLIPEGFERVKGIKGLEDMVVPSDLKPHLENTFKAFSSIESVNDFVKLYDKVQNTWKGFSTFFNPSFHSRNVVSNHWQLFLAGVDNPLAQVRGYRVEMAVRKALKEGKPATTYVTKKWKSLVDDFINDQGLRSTGAFSLDTDVSAASKLLDNPLGRTMGAAGEMLENSSKFSLYLDKRLKGFSSEAAGREVRKYLFDYSDLTDFEKNVMKRIFPFYTWTRKNIPLQVAMLIQKPARISSIQKAKESIEASRNGTKLDEKYMPEWLREAYPIYFGTAPDGLQRFIKLEGFLPTVDLNKLGRPSEVPFENLSPLIKTPIELISNYDFYFEKQISEFKGQKKFVPLVPFTSAGLNVDAKLAKVLGNFRPLGELQKFTVDPSKGQQPSTPEQLINFLIGKTYQLDPSKQKSIFDYVQGKQLGNLEADIKAARARGDLGEAARLLLLQREASKGNGLKL